MLSNCIMNSSVAFPVASGFYGEGNGTVYTVTCPGGVRLTNLTECTISNQTTGCSHSQDGGVICAGWFAVALSIASRIL